MLPSAPRSLIEQMFQRKRSEGPVMHEPSTRPPVTQGFVTTDDGIRLHWRRVGEGGPGFVCNNGIGVSTSFWSSIVEAYSPSMAVVVWDYRGHGKSGRTQAHHDLRIPRLALDLGYVCEAAGLVRPILLGHSMGAQVILERVRQAPGSAAGLVSILGTYGHPLDTFNNLAASRQIFDVLIALAHRFPRGFDHVGRHIVTLPMAFRLARLLRLVDPERCPEADLAPYMSHLVDLGFPFFFKMAQHLGEHSALDYLPSVDVPTLVIAGEFDGFTPRHLAVRMAERLPDSRLVELKGASHAGIIEQPDEIRASLDEWLRDRVGAVGSA